MNPFFVTDFSISDSLKTVRKSVLIYETIINSGCEQLPFIHITLFVFLRKPETFLPYLPHQPSHINHMTAVLLQNL